MNSRASCGTWGLPPLSRRWVTAGFAFCREAEKSFRGRLLAACRAQPKG